MARWEHQHCTFTKNQERDQDQRYLSELPCPALPTVDVNSGRAILPTSVAYLQTSIFHVASLSNSAAHSLTWQTLAATQTIFRLRNNLRICPLETVPSRRMAAATPRTRLAHPAQALAMVQRRPSRSRTFSGLMYGHGDFSHWPLCVMLTFIDWCFHHAEPPEAEHSISKRIWPVPQKAIDTRRRACERNEEIV